MFASSTTTRIASRIAAITVSSLFHLQSFTKDEIPSRKENLADSVSPAAYKAVSLASRGELAKAQEILKTLNQTVGKVANDTGVSPLFDVIERNDSVTLLWCLKNQCDPNAKADGQTPLHRAMKYYVDPKLTQHLLEYSARVDEPDQYGRTPLNKLAESDCSDNENAILEKASLLLDAGADPNKAGKNFLGETPLALAISEKNAKLARLLIQRGANTKRASKCSSKSALDLIRETGDIKTMDLVIDLLM